MARAENDRQLRDILQRACQESGSPAAAGIVVSHDSVVAQAAVGVRRLGDDTPVTIDDRFHSGSTAKAMTATVCAMLVAHGLLSWETTPLDVFTDLPGKILPSYQTVTLQMLLRHLAGIPPYSDDESEDFVVPDWRGAPAEQHVSIFARWLLQERGPLHQPGTNFAYSNAGYTIAAAMAEAVSGKPWRELLQDYLFVPLGMDAVAAGGWPALHDPHQPWGHGLQHGRVAPHDPTWGYQLLPFLAPAGDVSLSLPAYGRFLQMNLQALQGRQTTVPAEVLRRLHNDGQPGYGMGWGVTAMRSMEELGLFSTHAGSAGTFVMAAAIAHARDRAVAFATNSGLMETLDLAFRPMIARFVGDR